jgi:hypothetical protein
MEGNVFVDRLSMFGVVTANPSEGFVQLKEKNERK